jgi:16S rRNA (guanine1207-N2)-methyltransferase
VSYQYFDNVENQKNELKEIEYEYFGNKLKFITNVGVFSKSGIDYGTQVLLRTIDFNTTQKRILDVGCGYGAIGISISSRYKDTLVTMIDINKRAVELTLKNIAINNISNAEALVSDLYQNVVDKFDVIVSNPPIRAGKHIVHSILEGAFERLNDRGELIVVIQKKQGAPSAMKKMEQLFQNVEIVRRDAGYHILKSIKTK